MVPQGGMPCKQAGRDSCRATLALPVPAWRGFGGARKLRWRRPGTGKSGGYRIITYFAGRDVPVFLLTVFTKGERANLSDADRNAIRDTLPSLLRPYRKGA